MKLSDNEKRDVIKFLESDRPLPDKYRFLLFDDDRAVDFNFERKKEIIRTVRHSRESGNPEYEDTWTGNYIFENEWQSFRTKKDRSLELISASKEVTKGSHKVAVKVVDIFGNDTTRVIGVNI